MSDHSAEYTRYISSKKWGTRRARYFASNKKKCAACGRREGVQLHHLTYESMGQEPDGDLMPLCQPCHSDVHDLARRSGESLRFVSEAYAAVMQQKGLKAARRLTRRRDQEPKKAPAPAGHWGPPPGWKPAFIREKETGQKVNGIPVRVGRTTSAISNTDRRKSGISRGP